MEFKMDNTIIDVSELFPTALRAERSGNNTLILRNCKIKRFDGKVSDYELTHYWHKDGASVHEVQGDDYTYWTKSEIKYNECLFEQVNLF